MDARWRGQAPRWSWAAAVKAGSSCYWRSAADESDLCLTGQRSTELGERAREGVGLGRGRPRAAAPPAGGSLVPDCRSALRGQAAGDYSSCCQLVVTHIAMMARAAEEESSSWIVACSAAAAGPSSLRPRCLGAGGRHTDEVRRRWRCRQEAGFRLPPSLPALPSPPFQSRSTVGLLPAQHQPLRCRASR